MTIVILDSDCFTEIISDWSRKRVPSSQQVRCKTEINLDLVTHVFLRLMQFTWFYSEFSLANDESKLCSDWPLCLLWFLVF